MRGQERRRFTFVSQALEEDAFEVVRFRGTEGISRLYEFEITLVSENPEIDLRAVLRNPATLTIIREEGDVRRIHGIPSQFEQLHEDAERVFYKTVLVPRIWHADLYRENQLFLDKRVPEVIEEILRQTNLTTNDYESRLTATYPQWEYICQYGETDFDFISRWMEREGIYYYFQQTEEFEKLVITDNASSHEDVSDTSTIEYHPPSSLRAREEEVVRELICRQKMLPRRVILRDYNYRRPDLELRGEADVDPQGRGDVYSYGEHFKTPEEGNALAAIRAEEILCRESVFTGESTAPMLCPGFVFALTGHYRDAYNQRFLILEMEHEGDQSGALFGEEGTAAGGSTGIVYSNRFTGIPADLQFRPERITPRPRFFGTMNAKVDAAGDGQYAEIDDEGRYRVRLAFDQSDRQDGRASRYIRMSQPYAGAEYGMHFPLHKGTEVLLTFIDGDPDRPIIAGSVPNPENSSPVTANNQTQSMIRTGGGNEIKIEDAAGAHLIKLSTPHQNTTFRIGAPNSPGEPGIELRTDGHEYTTVGGHRIHRNDGNMEVTIDGHNYTVVNGNVTREFHSDSRKVVHGNQSEEVYGNKTSKTVGNTKEEFYGTKNSTSVAAVFEKNLSAKTCWTAGVEHSTYVGAKIDIDQSVHVEKILSGKLLKAQKRLAKITSEHKEEVGSYELEATTDVKIEGGTEIELKRSGNTITISGSAITIKASNIKLDGNVEITGTVSGAKLLKNPSLTSQA